MNILSSKKVIEKIFEYDNYRLFLQDFFEAKKRENKQFSQRYFTKKAGFNAHNFCTLVVSGRRNLSTISIFKIIKAIGLKGKAASYFENLVYLNQARTIEDKEFFFHKVKKAGRKTAFYQVNKDQFFFYEKWYYPIVRELMVCAQWDDDYAKLAKMVRPSISPSDAKEAANLLLDTGMVKKNGDGSYRHSHTFVTSEKVPVFIKKKARRDVLLRGIESIDAIEASKKYAAYATVSMSKALYEEARELLDDVREKILARVEDDTPPHEIYEVVLQVFPVSKMVPCKKKSPGGSGGER